MKIVKSPFLLIGSMALVASAAGAFYYLVISTEGFNPIAGAYLVVFLIAIAVALLIEQIILNKYKPKNRSIWLVEFLIIALATVYFIYGERKIIYQIDENTEWFVIVEDESLNQDKGQYSFPFDRIFEIPENGILIINPSEIGSIRRHEITGNSQWSDYQISGTSAQMDSKNYGIDVYSMPGTDSKKPDTQEILEIIKTQGDR